MRDYSSELTASHIPTCYTKLKEMQLLIYSGVLAAKWVKCAVHAINAEIHTNVSQLA